MTVQYAQTDTASTHGIGAYCSGLGGPTKATFDRECDKNASLGVGTTIIQVNSTTTGYGAIYESSANQPGETSWPSGTWTVRVNVTTGNTDVILDEVWICRVNSSGVSQGIVGNQTGINQTLSAAVYTYNITGSSQSAASDDRFIIVLGCKQGPAGHNPSVTITNNQYIDAPFVEVDIFPYSAVVEEYPKEIKVENKELRYYSFLWPEPPPPPPFPIEILRPLVAKEIGVENRGLRFFSELWLPPLEPPIFPYGILRDKTVPESIPVEKPRDFWRFSGKPFFIPILKDKDPREVELFRRRLQEYLEIAAPPVPPVFPYEILRVPKKTFLEIEREYRKDIGWLPGAGPGPEPQPFKIELYKEKVAKELFVERILKRRYDYLWEPPVPPPPFPLEILRKKEAKEQDIERVFYDKYPYLWPPPPPPPPFDIGILRKAKPGQILRIERRFVPAILAKLIPVCSLTTTATWPNQIQFVEGDQWLVILEGASPLSNPKVILIIEFE